MMKRLILLTVVGVIAAFCVCYWYMAPNAVPAQTHVAQGDVEKARVAVLPSNAEIPPSSKPAVTADVQKVTADRRRILDSSDALATIENVRKSGTADEKDWAASLLASCAVLFVEMPKLSPEMEAAHSQNQPEDPALTSQKKHATEVLSDRCRGVKKLTTEERVALRHELQAHGNEAPTTLRQLDYMTTSSDSRWSGEQAQMLTNALYSGDPVVARAAFFALLHAVDFDAPGGHDRQAALMFALGSVYANAPLSEYESLQSCRTSGQCYGQPNPQLDGPPLSPAALELQKKYEAAIASHMDARSIMAIR